MNESDESKLKLESIENTKSTIEMESAKATIEMEKVKSTIEMDNAKFTIDTENVRKEIRLKYSNLKFRIESYNPEKINEVDVTEIMPRKFRELDKTMEELTSLVNNLLLDFPKADVNQEYRDLLVKAVSDVNQHKKRILEKAIEVMKDSDHDFSSLVITSELAKEAKLEDIESKTRVDTVKFKTRLDPVTSEDLPVLESDEIDDDEDTAGSTAVELGELVACPELAQGGEN